MSRCWNVFEYKKEIMGKSNLSGKNCHFRNNNVSVIAFRRITPFRIRYLLSITYAWGNKVITVNLYVESYFWTILPLSFYLLWSTLVHKQLLTNLMHDLFYSIRISAILPILTFYYKITTTFQARSIGEGGGAIILRSKDFS